ncbi:hypothetical protein MMC28_001155 [Mycoblastus sanguinarius]|nr:hypothetical protein [Mycoblastus sanguinarius]
MVPTSKAGRLAKRLKTGIDRNKTAQISSSSMFHSAGNPNDKNHPSNQHVLAAAGSCSPQEKCQLCNFMENSHQESKPADLSTHPPFSESASTCTLCDSEPQTSECCQSIFEGGSHSESFVCTEPECSLSICEECSDHEECCTDCVGYSDSDCESSFDYFGNDCRVHNNYPFASFNAQLFGDQAAEMFGLDGRLPQLPMETEFLVSSGSGLPSQQISTLALNGHGLSERSFGSGKGLNLFENPTQLSWEAAAGMASSKKIIALPLVYSLDSEWARSFEIDPVAASNGVATECASYPPRPSCIQQNNTSTSPALSTTRPPSHSADSTQGKAVPTIRSNGTSVLDSDAVQEDINFSSRCQWADQNGQCCGETFAVGSDLHEHLKTAHGVKNEVFCRWVGCRVGVFGPTPHQFASSVQRHCWGHSGYRPYQCPICLEGFASAKVRDEHFGNFHLKKKEFSCDRCTHQCTSATNLKRHKDEKHRSERFQCEFCNQDGKRTLFPRGPNLARHFRKCKYVLALFPDANGAAKGKIDDVWFPPGYRGGHHGMDRAKVVPPNYFPVPNGV